MPVSKTSRAMLFAVLGVFALAAWAWPFLDDDENPTFAPLLRATTPAVVNVAVASAAPEPADNPFGRFFDLPLPEQFNMPLPEQFSVPRQGIGSGVIVDAERGLIISNAHVVQNASEIIVTLTDRRQYRAEVIGTDAPTDVALLRIDADDLTQVELGDSDELEVGDFVVAIGNPFGIGQTATAGIVSALGRGVLGNEDGYQDFIQTDASINPGNSGGALVGLDGTVKGINTAILSPGGGNIGIGFAIPSNMVTAVVDQLLEYGEVRRGRIGVLIQDVTPALATALQLGTQNGALVTDLEAGGPAEQAGVEVNDIVTHVNGQAIVGSSDLRNAIGLARLGETVRLGILRDDRTVEIDVTVGAAPSDAASGDADGPPADDTRTLLEGAELTTLAPEDPRSGGRSGVLVTALLPGSPAARIGLLPGDVITAVGRKDIASVAELSEGLAAAQRPVALRVLREDRPLYLVVE